MDIEVKQLVEQIHKTDHKVVLVTTGVGTMAQAWLFGVAGASRTMLEAHVPYSKQSFIDLIGREPKKYVSGKAARLLAGYALNRAAQLAGSVQYPLVSTIPLLGVSCSGAISTDRPKKGLHHAYISIWMEHEIREIYIQLDKDGRTRSEEEEIVSRLILNAVAEGCGISTLLDVDLNDNDVRETKSWKVGRLVKQLLAQEIQYVGVYDHGQVKSKGLNPQALLPGSFNPLHFGHRELANVASKILGHPIAFELSAFNVDKPPLESHTILKRLTQFAGHYPIYVTNAPTFLEKARLFPNTTFVIGYDTAERVPNPKYYNNSRADMLSALSEILDLGCRFLVAGRTGKDGVYLSADRLVPPPGYEALFESIPDEMFREDISSSEIRQTVVD